MRITEIKWEVITPAPSKAGRVSLTSPIIKPSPMLMVRVEGEDGIVGESTTIFSGPGLASVLSILQHDLTQLLIGENPCRIDALFRKVDSAFRSTGFSGLVSRAYSSIDLALWDLQAKAAGQSLGALLGGARSDAPFFASDTGGPSRSAEEIVTLAKPWIKKGAKGVLVEVGSGDVQADADRVRAVSDELGDDAWVGVNACGRYDLGTALALAHFYDDVGIGWFEEPLPVSDVAGYQRLADRMETTLAAGAFCHSLGELVALAKAGAVRVLRPDCLRIGGLTPLLKLATIADACHCSMVPVRQGSISEQLCLGLSCIPQYERETS